MFSDIFREILSDFGVFFKALVNLILDVFDLLGDVVEKLRSKI